MDPFIFNAQRLCVCVEAEVAVLTLLVILEDRPMTFNNKP